VKATITSELNISANDAWHLVKKSSTLTFVTKGLLSFSDCDHFPAEWIEGSTVVSRLRFFGIISAWNHQTHFLKVSDTELEIITEEKGGIVSKWKHRIKISSMNKGATCLYTDEVEIEAGLLTPGVWWYANLLYRYRQFRWKSLIS
jgi:hypothetical protein